MNPLKFSLFSLLRQRVSSLIKAVNVWRWTTVETIRKYFSWANGIIRLKEHIPLVVKHGWCSFVFSSNQFDFDSELNHLGKFAETKQRKLAYSVYCTMKTIRVVLTTRSLLMSTKHLIAAGAHPKWTNVTLSPPSLTLMFVLQVGATTSQRRGPQSPGWSPTEETSPGIRGPGGPQSKLEDPHLFPDLTCMCPAADLYHSCQ